MCSNAGKCHWFRIGILLFTFALTWLPIQAQVPLEEFFPFGVLNGDTANDREDDGGSDKIFLSVNFTFYEQAFHTLFVNNNGFLTFEKEKEESSSYKPQTFPLENNLSLIAPFWADADIEHHGGNVTHRQTNSVELLELATDQVRKFFFLEKPFTWMYIATWDEVGYYGARGLGLNKSNTFQVALATNEKESFVFFLYNKLEWTSGANSGGNVSTGLGGDPAQVGFNSGDGVNYFQIDGAQTDAVINLTRISNVGVPGKWIFGVSGPQVRDVQCNHDVQIKIVPNTGTMLGGEEFRIIGPCFQSDLNVTARVANTNITFQCAVINYVSAKCVAPPIFKTGEVTLELNPYGISWNYSAVLSLENVALTAPKVVREDLDKWIVGNNVSVSWNSTSLPSSDMTVDVMAYQYNQGVPIFTTIQSVEVNGKSTNVLITLSEDLQRYQSAVVRVRDTLTGSLPLAIWSDVFPVRFNAKWSSDVCVSWNSTEAFLPSIEKEYFSCPCIAKQAARDTGRFESDPFCNLDNKDLSTNCAYKPGATRCFLRILQNESSSGASCCYDKEGDLIDIRDSNGGGTHLRYKFRSQGNGVVPYFTFFEQDLLPSLHCCQYSKSSDMCQLFRERRPPVTCDQYEPPTAAQAAGDPHLTTLDGFDYTFNGLGDFILTEDNTTGVVVQVRAVPAQDMEGHSQNASVFSAVAIAVRGVSDVVEVRKDSSAVSEILVNGSLVNDLSTSVKQFKGISIQKNRTDPRTDNVIVVLETVGLSVSLDVSPDLINILVIVGDDGLKGKLCGLLGNFNGNPNDDFVSRQGNQMNPNMTSRAMHFDFGMTWAVPESERLFSNTEVQDSGYFPRFMDEGMETTEQTREICKDNPQCAFDFDVTENEAIAKSTVEFINKFNELKKDLVKVVRCPYLDQPENALKNVSGYSNGSIAIFECLPGFTNLGGSTVRHCKEDGTWDGSDLICALRENDLSGSDIDQVLLLAGGSAGGVLFIIIIIIIVCRCLRRKPKKLDDVEQPGTFDIDLAVILTPSNIPQPVFENEEFLEILEQINSGDGFKIPRPSYVDPQLFDEYFF